jgi:hypothetical protein
VADESLDRSTYEEHGLHHPLQHGVRLHGEPVRAPAAERCDFLEDRQRTACSDRRRREPCPSDRIRRDRRPGERERRPDVGSWLRRYFRSNGDPGATTFAGYCFQYDTGFTASGSFVLRKFQYGGQTAIKWVDMPAGYAKYGTSHTTSVSAVGNHIVCKVDGVTMIDYTDSSSPFLSGSSGLRSWSNSQVAFTSAQVQAGAGGTGSGSPSKGDFAYAPSSTAVTFGLVGWLAGSSAFVIQPLQ